MSRGQHRQGNKHGKVSTRGERGTSKILRGIPNVLEEPMSEIGKPRSSDRGVVTPRPKWNSGMPVESMRVPRGASSPLRGQHEMPDGVVEPMFVAAVVMAEFRRGLSIRRSASRRPAGEIITVTGARLSEQEILDRERLFAAIRTGDRTQAASAAEELWQTHGAWVIPGAQETKNV